MMKTTPFEPTGSGALFRAENLSAGYGQQEIIHCASFSLNAGTLTGLLGPNGCGKTTLIRCVINQLPHQGQCYLKDQPLESLNQRQLARSVSYIAQRSGLSLALPALEVVLMGFNPVLKLLEYPGAVQKQRAMDALEQVGLADFARKDFQTLSEGQKQLVLLARTMIEDTPLLVLDEPDSALDFQNRWEMLKQLKRLVNCNSEADPGHPRAGLLCLHDPGLALEFCDQILLMKEGRVIHALHPASDPLDVMEAAFRDLYGHVSLAKVPDRRGTPHFALLWEGMI